MIILGNDLSNRLKALEEENAALKRQQIELNLQLMEHEQDQLMGIGPSCQISFIPHLMDLCFPKSGLSTARQISDERTAKDLSGSTPEDTASIERSQSEGTIEEPTTPTAASASQQQLINQLKTKQRDLEKTIGTLKHKEVCPCSFCFA